MSSQFPDFEIFKSLYQQRLASLLQCVSSVFSFFILQILQNQLIASFLFCAELQPNYFGRFKILIQANEFTNVGCI